MDNFYVGEWIITTWMSNKEFGVITSVHPGTSTLSISINPYKFIRTNTVESYRNVTRLTKEQSEKLEILTEELEAIEKRYALLKDKVNIAWVMKSTLD